MLKFKLQTRACALISAPFLVFVLVMIGLALEEMSDDPEITENCIRHPEKLHSVRALDQAQ